MRYLLIAAAALTAGCTASNVDNTDSEAAVTPADSVTAQVWVDNWFEMYANGEKVLEDSVPITTERSFNAETTTIDRNFPMTIAFMAMDFKENNSGLEYIGSNRQQVGDGGMIAQFIDNQTGAVVGVTDGAMRCLTVHRAPTELSCAAESNPVAGEGACGFVETAIPEGWTQPDFDDSAWPNATVWSVGDVSPKEGYDEISWDSRAQLVWGDDLKRDNTMLCRMTIGG